MSYEFMGGGTPDYGAIEQVLGTPLTFLYPSMRFAVQNTLSPHVIPGSCASPVAGLSTPGCI